MRAESVAVRNQQCSRDPGRRPKSSDVPVGSQANEFLNANKIELQRLKSSAGSRREQQQQEQQQQRQKPASTVSRSKSTSDAEKRHKDYVRWLYSSSWRIHSELLAQVDPNGGPDMSKPTDNTQTLFYSTNVKKPDTFIFDPSWV